MKIIEQSDPIFELLQTKWWVAETLKCDVCKTVFVVEEEDRPWMSGKTWYGDAEKDRTMARFQCPRCGKGVWAHFSDAVKRAFPEDTSVHHVEPTKHGWWRENVFFIFFFE